MDSVSVEDLQKRLKYGIAHLERQKKDKEFSLKRIEARERRLLNTAAPAPKRPRPTMDQPIQPGMRASAQIQKKDEDSKTLSSAIVAPPSSDKPSPAVRLNDEQTKQRSKRLFGFLSGHLAKAKTEWEHKSEAVVKQQEMVKRIEEREEKEKEEQLQVILTEKKKEEEEKRKADEDCHKAIEAFEKVQRLNKEIELCKFAKTETKPALYFTPKTHTAATQKLLDQVQEQREAKQKELQDLLASLPSSYFAENLPAMYSGSTSATASQDTTAQPATEKSNDNVEMEEGETSSKQENESAAPKSTVVDEDMGHEHSDVEI